METIDLHGLTLEEAKEKVRNGLESAFRRQESVVRIIHGQGKHSEVFPVIKSYVRHWLEDSEFAREKIESVFRGEDGSPYTTPNAGETIVVFRKDFIKAVNIPEISYEEEEEREARRNSKAIRADRARRRGSKWR